MSKKEIPAPTACRTMGTVASAQRPRPKARTSVAYPAQADRRDPQPLGDRLAVFHFCSVMPIYGHFPDAGIELRGSRSAAAAFS